MAFGKPAIGYNIEGLKELIKNNKTGYIIKKYDKNDMADCILKLLNDNELIEKFGYNAYNEVRKNFSLKKMLKKHREVFEYFNEF
jgi:glycosyltransferase involved in cell wall biosynthesis